MKHFRLLLAVAAACAVAALAQTAEAKITFEPKSDLQLPEAPKDIIFSRDGSTAFILGQKAILIYSIPESKVTDTIPLAKPYAAIALSPDESTFYLTATDSPKVGVIQYAAINTIETGKSPVIGNPKAPVTVAAFLDYQCPYCAKIYPLLQQLLKKYPNDVKLVIKQFPLPMHKFAEKASSAALAAARQNKFEKVTELFFTNYTTLNDETIRKYVQDAGVDLKKFDQDLGSPEIKSMLQQDQEAARQVRVRAVPTVFINGISPKGRSLEVFSQMIDDQLKKTK